jgi:hypothetical protein
MDWSQVFEEQYPEHGAAEDELDALEWLRKQPLRADEIAAVNATQRNPFDVTDPLHASYRPFDPGKWVMPTGPLPDSYRSFLRWSNGGEFRTGERWFQFFPLQEVRELLLGYHVPQYMPGALPFASDGGSVLYLFDMRNPPVDGEYPVLVASTGRLDYEAARSVGASFPAACAGKDDPESLLGGE